MPKKDKVDRGHYKYRGFDIVKDESRPNNPWTIYADYGKVTEREIEEFVRLRECTDFLEEYQPPKENAPEEEQRINSGKGQPVFVVTDDFLDQLETHGDSEFMEGKKLFKEVVKDEQNRIRIIFLALIRRKIKQLERMDMFSNRVEDLIEENIEQYSPEKLMDFYEAISKRLESESQEIGKIINSL